MSHNEPMIDVLMRMRAELEDIARRIDLNHAAIAKATWEIAASDPDYIVAMQDADLNAQRIAGLADFLQAIATEAGPNWLIDTSTATEAIKLTRLRRSLGLQGGDREPNAKSDSGDVELF